ncbi:shikimate dehydrogenase [Mesorhizobium sp. LHD-90]|uniref:shikimate dehydrogenase n=1 Tax=Mesorhizobium sp. LHD-90 TaxID=3071414 RepID=UPI0027E0598A|nr:shikimate dehydrogenase [Mesorhizobium sp. LHD-90]MDQ6434167.1 shikimate dehydrogenase [Mesorhizobium sp. LHD-90]
MAEALRKAFVCGHPIAHSRSPKIHGHWLKHYGLAGNYEAIDVDPAGFAEFAASVRAGRFAGGNVTIPHKEAAFAAVDRRDQAAQDIGAVNTLWVEHGLLHGSNTDAYGFAANLDDRAPGWSAVPGPVVVLGAGGAARAVLYALRERGFSDIRIVNRTVARARALAGEFGPVFSAHGFEDTDAILGDASLLVNTTALGMHGETEFPVDVGRLPGHALVTDIVYVPLETPLLAAARRRGLATVDGLGMLLYQAVPGFEKWFGVRPEVTPALRDLIVNDLLAKAA